METSNAAGSRKQGMVRKRTTALRLIGRAKKFCEQFSESWKR
jgi:hypothetical protein